MNVTIKMIADLAQVSRGTVDRVLHDRPGVKKEVREKILNILEALDYKPNLAGKALVQVNKKTKIGVVVAPDYNPFVEKLKIGISSEAKRISYYGVELDIEVIKTYDEFEQVAILDQFQREKISAISIMPIDKDPVRNKINSLTEDGIPVVTCNSDINGTKRLCFVGQDNYRAGRTVGGLLGKTVPRNSSIGVIAGTMSLLCHQNRINGFTSKINELGGISISRIEQNNDTDDLAFSITLDYIKSIPDLKAIYLTGGGIKGVGKALQALGKAGDIQVFCHDLIPESERLLSLGVIDFVIEQNPVQQGALPIRILFNYLFLKEKPTDSIIHTDISIYTADNIKPAQQFRDEPQPFSDTVPIS